MADLKKVGYDRKPTKARDGTDSVHKFRRIYMDPDGTRYAPLVVQDMQDNIIKEPMGDGSILLLMLTWNKSKTLWPIVGARVIHFVPFKPTQEQVDKQQQEEQLLVNQLFNNYGNNAAKPIETAANIAPQQNQYNQLSQPQNQPEQQQPFNAQVGVSEASRQNIVDVAYDKLGFK